MEVPIFHGNWLQAHCQGTWFRATLARFGFAGGLGMAKQGFLAGAFERRSSEEMREYFDRWSEIYNSELSENDYQLPRRCASAVSANLPDKSARILDLGCGTGLAGLALVEAGYHHIDGCDISTGMLEKAFETEIYSKLFIADINKPPLDSRNNEYDAITAVGVFSFGHVSIDAIDEFLRVSRPGAPIVIGVNDYFYREGHLSAKIDQLESDGRVSRISEEHGGHIPGISLEGWVIVFSNSQPDRVEEPDN
jgi:SAM-dependent methyltransferase